MKRLVLSTIPAITPLAALAQTATASREASDHFFSRHLASN